MATKLLLLAVAGVAAYTGAWHLPMQYGDPGRYWVFVGTQTGKKGGEGIYRCELDIAKGILSKAQLVAKADQPTFLAINPKQTHLYCVSEVAKADGKPGGQIRAYSLDAKSGTLTFINGQLSGGAAPCHLVVDQTGKCVLAANYGGGSVCSMLIKEDGSLAPATSVIQHQGKSVNQARQLGPHAHCIQVDADNRFAVAADLGIDKLLVYRFDSAKGTLDPHDPPSLDLAKGAGPRHFAFHPNGRFGYVINELDSTMTAMSYDAARGELKHLQTLSTLPAPQKNNFPSEVVVHPGGKFLYGANRGHNSIAVFAINEATGQLTALGHQTAGIKNPRNFALDPTGTFLIVTNQDDNSLVMFRVNPATGELTPAGERVEIPRPMCVRFVKRP